MTWREEFGCKIQVEVVHYAAEIIYQQSRPLSGQRPDLKLGDQNKPLDQVPITKEQKLQKKCVEDQLYMLLGQARRYCKTLVGLPEPPPLVILICAQLTKSSREPVRWKPVCSMRTRY
jgi:hypothetical protein